MENAISMKIREEKINHLIEKTALETKQKKRECIINGTGI